MSWISVAYILLVCREFGGVREACLARADHFWNARLCFCESRRTRGAGPDLHYAGGGAACGGGAVTTGAASYLQLLSMSFEKPFNILNLIPSH